MGKGKGIMKKTVKRLNIEDKIIKNDADMIDACKAIARAIYFVLPNTGEKDNSDDGIFILAETDTDAIIHALGGLNFIVPKSGDKKAFIFHDHISGTNFRLYAVENNEKFKAKMKGRIKDIDKLCGMLVRYVKNDVTVAPIYLDTEEFDKKIIEEMDTIFPNGKKLTNDELDFIIDDVIDSKAKKIYELLRSMFIFTEDNKKEIMKNKAGNMYREIMLKTMLDK